LKTHKILAVVGYLLIMFGIGAIVWQGFLSESTGTQSMTIPAGEGYYAAFYTKSSMWMNAHFEGTVSVDTGQVDMYFLTEEQYAAYSYDLNPGTSLWQNGGTTQGKFSLDLPEMGRYYVTVDHSRTTQTIAQTVTLTYKISGINLLYVIIGAILLAIGGALSYLAVRMRKKDAGSLPAPVAEPVAEVKMFDSKQKLQ